MKPKFTVDINENDLLDLIHFARRYCDGRMTGVSDTFNEIYNRLNDWHPGLMARERTDIHVVKGFPYATDGMDMRKNNERV